MTRVCSGCGLNNCEGRCFTQCEQDFEGDPEMDAWLAQCQREEAELAARVNRRLEPRRAGA